MASKLSLYLAELKRRMVYRVAAVYVVVGAGIIGLGEAALPPIDVAVGLSGAVPFFESIRGIVLAAVGRVTEARDVLEDLKARSGGEYVDPYNLVNLTATLDGFDDAALYLDEALEVRSFFLPYLGVVPRYRPLHSDPRFRAVLEKVSPGVSFEV